MSETNTNGGEQTATEDGAATIALFCQALARNAASFDEQPPGERTSLRWIRLFHYHIERLSLGIGAERRRARFLVQTLHHFLDELNVQYDRPVSDLLR